MRLPRSLTLLLSRALPHSPDGGSSVGSWIGGLLALLLLAAPAAAQNVLMLATNEGAADAQVALANMQAEFTNAGATVTRLDVLDIPGAVTAATFSAASYDAVIIGNAYVAIDPGNWSAVDAAITSRAANSFIVFNDGCCVAGNVALMVGSLNAAAPGWGAALGGGQGGYAGFPLNTNSPYAANFTLLNPLRGGWVTYIANVPADNVLYLPTGATPPAAGTTPTSAYGAFLPATQSHGGTGACIFATVDVSPFDASSYPVNAGKIASAFLNAARAGGACGLSAQITKAYSPTSVDAGGTTTLTISVSNLSGAPVNGLVVNDTLPNDLLVAGPVTTSCTGGTLSAAPGGNTISLTGATLPAAGCTLTVPVIWPIAATCNITTLNTITPGTQFSTAGGQVNTPAAAELACPSQPDVLVGITGPASVPRGGTAVFTITVTSVGGATTGGPVTLSHPLPAGLTLVSVAGAGCTALPCALGTMLPGDTRTVVVTVNVPAAYAGNTFSQTSSAAAVPGETLLANNVAPFTTVVTAAVIPSAVVQVPTLQTWGLLLLLAGMGFVGWTRLRSR